MKRRFRSCNGLPADGSAGARRRGTMRFGLSMAVGCGERAPRILPGPLFGGVIAEHYNYFRDYDPGIGRYVQSDPIGLDGGLNTYGYVSARPTTGTDPLGLFGPAGAAGGAIVSFGIQFEVCRQLGGNLNTCLKCINFVDVAISAGMGAVAPTWLGNVGKGLMQLRKTRELLKSAGGPAMGAMASNKVGQDAAGAAIGTGAGFIGKVNLPSLQIGCEDECKKFRLSPEQMSALTSFF